MWGIFIFSPNDLTASAAGKRMLNQYHTCFCISPQMNDVILGVHVDVWDPFAIA